MSDNATGRTVPYSQEAERSVLGAVLFDPQQISTVIGAVKEEDFYLEANREVFAAMMDLFHQNKPIDVVVLKEQLITRGSFEAIGGLSYLADLAAGVPTTENINYYLKIVSEKSDLRRLIKAGSEIVQMSYEAKEELPVIMDAAEQKIFEILQKRSSEGFSSIQEVLPETIKRLEELSKNQSNVTGIPTGLIDLDQITAGLHNSDLILIAARPSMGKSSLALNIAGHAAAHSHVTTAFFSLEMSKEQIVNRLLCAEALVDSHKMTVGGLDETDWEKLLAAYQLLADAPFFIDDTAGISINEIRAKCKRLKLKHNLGLVVIDYLQLMQGRRSESRQQEVSDISRSLKIMAKELDIPVIALSQLNRAPDQRTDHRPMLSDLRESGSIEQDADIIMFIYRDDFYNPDSEEKNVAECLLSKHRNGSTGTVKMCWLGQFTKFCDMERTYDG